LLAADRDTLVSMAFEHDKKGQAVDQDPAAGPKQNEAEGADLLRKIVDARGLGARDIAEGIAELLPDDRAAVMSAVQTRFGNSFANEVEQAMANPKSKASPLNVKEQIYQARLGADGRQEGVIGDAHQVANQDIILEQLAHAGAYGDLDNRKLTDWGYRHGGAIEDPESGFRAVLYLPIEPTDARQAATIRAMHGGNAPPVVSFRGTDNKRGVADDMNRHGVGSYQFASNQTKIAALLAKAGGKAIVTGHSLGGALAQIAGARFAGSVSRIVTFQAPAIDGDDVDRLREHNQKAAPQDRVTSTHHRAEGDLVHLAGEKLTDGDVFTYESVGVGNPMDHTQFPLARLAAARGNLIPGLEGDDRLVRVEKTTSQSEKSGWFPRFAEGARKLLGGVLRDDDMEPYVEMWRDVQQMLASGAFSQQYVLAVIKDSNRLTDVQKIKMRDQVLAMS
jgi:pimeloyl-ACP methyl ester carboxylesterase